MMGNKPDSLENVVKDNYIIYLKKEEPPAAAEEETRQLFRALVQRVEQLQQQYGTANFSYRMFEFTPAIAAVIKGEAKQEIIETLQKEGYMVKEQGRMSIQAEKIERFPVD